MRVELNSIAYTMNQLSLMHTSIVETESNFYGDGGVMKSGGGSNSPRLITKTGTYLKGVSPCRKEYLIKFSFGAGMFQH